MRSVFSPFRREPKERERFCSGIAKKEGGRSVFAKEEANPAAGLASKIKYLIRNICIHSSYR